MKHRLVDCCRCGRSIYASPELVRELLGVLDLDLEQTAEYFGYAVIPAKPPFPELILCRVCRAEWE